MVSSTSVSIHTVLDLECKKPGLAGYTSGLESAEIQFMMVLHLGSPILSHTVERLAS